MKIDKAYLIVGIVFFAMGVFIIWFFNNPYPCTVSGIGCHDVWEMLRDTGNNYVGLLFIVIGMPCFYNIFIKDDEQESGEGNTSCGGEER